MFVHFPGQRHLLLSIALCAVITLPVTASDIASDSLEQESETEWEVILPPQTEQAIDAYTEFYALLNELTRARQISDAQIKHLFAILDKTPGSPYLVMNLLAELRRSGKADLVTEHFFELAKKHPSQFMLTAIAADLLQLRKRNPDALLILRRTADFLKNARNRDELLQNQSGYAEYVLLKLAILLAMDKNYAESEKRIQEIASWKIFRDNPFLLQLSLINQSALRKHASDNSFLGIFPSEKEKAQEKFEKTANAYLKGLEEIQAKGLCVDLKKHAAGLKLLAMEKHPGADSILLGNLLNREDDTAALLSLAEHYIATRRPHSAVRVWKQIFRSSQNQPLWFYLAYGNALAAAEMTKEAIGVYELALLMAPNDNNLKLRLAQLLYSNGNYKKALDAITGIPNPAARSLAALCSYFLDDPAEALKYFKDLYQPTADGTPPPGAEHIPFLYAETAEKAKEYLLAEKILRDYLRQYPESAAAMNFLGYLFAERGSNLDEAEKLIRAALKLEPDKRDYLDSMAWVFYRRTHYAEALKWIRKAIESEPEKPFSATIWDHAGDIHHALGNKADALRCWKEAVSNYTPEPVDIGKILEKIKNSGAKP